MNVPAGFGTITPYLFVENAVAFSEFLRQAFEGEEVGRTTRPDGVIANLQVRVGTVTVMISEASARYPAMPTSFYVYVDDADATMTKAVNAGAAVEMEVADMSYQDRQGGVRDPFGNIWWVSQRLVDQPYH